MDRISTLTKLANLFGIGKSGFQDGNLAAGVSPTAFNAAWCNGVQEELLAIVEGAGVTPDATKYNQAARVIQAGSLAVGTAVNTSDAIVGTFTLPPTTLIDGMKLEVRCPTTNTTATPTFTPIAGVLNAAAIVKGTGAPLVPGDLPLLPTLKWDATLVKWVLMNPVSGLRAQVQTITASVASNALTLGLAPTSLDFRSATQSSGVVNTRTFTSAPSLTVQAGATLGTTAATSARLVLLALDNAGIVELAVVNLNGSTNLDESTLISTTAISSTSSSAGVVYSATARAAVPFRVVGYIDIVEAVPGTWTSGPTSIQGAGGLNAGMVPVTTVNDSGFSDNSAKPVSSSWIRGAFQTFVANCIAAVATAAGFSASLTVNGYIKFPSWLGGLIVQWGTGTVTTGTAMAASSTYEGQVTVTFPIAFPNSYLVGFANGRDINPGNSEAATFSYGSTTSALLVVRSSQISTVMVGDWLAIGR